MKVVDLELEKKSNYGGYLDTLNQVLKKESSFDKKNKDIKYNEVKIKYIEENLLNLLTAIYSANNSIIDIQNNIIKFYLCILNIKLYYTQLFYYQDRDPRVIVNNDNYINMFQGRYQYFIPIFNYIIHRTCPNTGIPRLNK
jgi:hypothetical protein